MSNLSFFYQKLFSVPGYSFIMDEDGNFFEWDSAEMRSKGFYGPGTLGSRLHLVPGSFNPLHESHREIYENVFKDPNDGEELRPTAFFEMSIERVDKAVVTLPQLDRRLQQFHGYAPVVISRAPRFVEKIGICLSHVKGVTFHVGIDCIVRMKDDYGLCGIQGLAAKFVVYDRIINNKHMSLTTEFGNFIPRNCSPAALVRSVESLTRSSSQLREETGEDQ